MTHRQPPSGRRVRERPATADALIQGRLRALIRRWRSSLTRPVIGMLQALLVALLTLSLGVPAGLAASSSTSTITPSAATSPGEGIGAAAEQPVVEQLRLEVPEKYRQIWLEAERSTWEPWLAGQDGFLGRELLWDPLHGEATLLIRWASRRQWKAIPQAEIEAVQARFERQVNLRLGSQAPNPFPLLYEGELITP